MNINQILRKILKEATSDSSGSRGSYIGPLQPGVREFKKIDLQPFTMPVSKYNNAMLQYDSYDGKMSSPKKQINKIEKKSKRISDYIKNHPNSTFSDEDGNVINQTPGKNLKIVPVNKQDKITESSTSISAGEYSGPIEIGLRKWKNYHLDPFIYEVGHEMNRVSKQKTLKNNVSRVVGVWDKNKNGSYDYEVHDVHTIKEDLSVWFGDKKKSKGSSEPQGPWVNICSNKKGGGHPPCGRPDSDSKGYPKCRATGVAAKMTDAQKKSACQQKRSAEKKDTQTGKGQKPTMTSYKPRTNENMKRKIITLTENDLMRIVKRVIREQKEKPTISENQEISLTCQDYKLYTDEVTKTRKIKLYSKYIIEGKLSTDSKVLEGESFTDKGHLAGDPYGSGFVSEPGPKYGLSFYVDETNGPSPLDQVYGATQDDNLQQFDLIPITQEYKDFIGMTGSGDHMIFHIEGGRRQSFCIISSNTPSEEFKKELSSNWGLNNDLF